MKRELKFRAWSIDQKRFINLNGVDIAFKGCLNEGSIDLIYEQGNLHTHESNDIELLQFTGLKDKNNKEIYEGDILRTVNHFDINNKPVYLHHKVVYDMERAAFNAINLSNDNDLLTTNGNCFLYVALKSALIEVIGNIYETPELIH